MTAALVSYVRVILFGVAFGLTALSALAQGTLMSFGQSQPDRDAPVQVNADSLSVDQETGQAIFEGNVVVAQGDIRLSAAKVFVVYKEETDGIERLEAEGDVVLVNGADAAEAQRAVYDIDSGNIDMTGDVLLTRGQSVVRAERMVVNLESGSANLTGRVSTVLNRGDN